MSLDRYMKEHPQILEKYPIGVYAVTDITDRVVEECNQGVIYCLKQKTLYRSSRRCDFFVSIFFSVCREKMVKYILKILILKDTRFI